ncbi:MAG: type IV toxin-antitoxin system AbiEi family antitoxin domain-containing protein [Solirubrobacterales bacterium]
MARRSHGVVTRTDLLAAGVSVRQIERRLKRGTLIRVHRGVYRVGHAAPSREAAYLAAVKACGPGALLAGRAAAHLWRLIRGAPPRPEVLAPSDRRVPGVIVHRARAGERARHLDATRLLGIPVTTVPRTLVDLASSLPASELARACHEAGVLHGTIPRQVEAVLARRPNATGSRKLRRIIHGDEPVVLSRLESLFLARLRATGLPLPETNRVAGGRRVDCRWPRRRLTVELDSYRFHASRHAWERDRQREREARGRGDEFRRYTWADVSEDPEAMLAELRSLLLAKSGRPPCGSGGP